MKPTLSHAERIDCPPAEKLQAFSAAALPRESMDAVEAHLTHCEMCLSAVEAWEEQSDEVVRALATLPSLPEDEAAFQSLHAALLSHCESIPLADAPTATFTPSGGQVSDQVPEVLGGYHLLELLGQGATGAVFRARHLKLDRIVAMKVLNARYVGYDARAVRRFHEEMRAVGQLDHPNIVRATDAGEADGRHYLVMEFVDGIDASRLLRMVGPLRVADACEIVRQAALGLHAAHEHQMVHRDVKPSNMLFTFDGQVKLLDLGLVRSEQSDAENRRLWQTDIPHGTADYMPPEQWTQFASVDRRADLYALGCTLYKLLTGKPPYPRAQHDYEGKRQAHRSAPIPKVRHERPEVPLGLQKILIRLLAKRPEDRYETAAEVAERLAVYAQGAQLVQLGAQVSAIGPADRSLAAPDPEPSASAAATSWRPNRRQVLAAGAATLALGAAVWQLWPSRHAARLRVGQWRNLQPTQPPTAFPFADGALARNSHRVDYDRAEGTVTVSTRETVLCHFGQPVVGRFALRADIRCRAPFDRVGLFFKYRPRQSPSGELVHKFHAIEIAPGELEQGALLWSYYCFYQGAGSNYRLVWIPLAEAPLALADAEVQGRLEVRLGRIGFPEVKWNGEAMSVGRWTVSKDGRQESEPPRDKLPHAYLGRLGILARAATASFSQLQLLYSDDQETV